MCVSKSFQIQWFRQKASTPRAAHWSHYDNESMGSYQINAVVLDCGSCSIKAGFAGEIRPVVSRPNATTPIRAGIVQDWDALERLYIDVIYKDLHRFPADQPLVLVEPPQLAQESVEQLAELAFEGLDVPQLCLGNHAQLALYASYAARQAAPQSALGHNLLTGLVVESGDSLTTVTPIVDGFIIPSGVRCSTLAGSTVTQCLQTLLRRKGPQSETPQHVSWSLAAQLKKQHCFARTDVSSEWNVSGPGKEPDGTTRRRSNLSPVKRKDIGDEAWQAAEILFNPSSFSKENVPSLPELIEEAAWSCPIDTRRALYSNIVLSGGNSLLRGLKERLQAELASRLRNRLGDLSGSLPIHVTVHPKFSRHAVWLGGSILGTSEVLHSMAITREAYQEHGASVLDQRVVSLCIQ